jgi:hypothetical protein
MKYPCVLIIGEVCHSSFGAQYYNTIFALQSQRDDVTYLSPDMTLGDGPNCDFGWPTDRV